jgi:peptidoglycan/LPS O-acetylase OafA/YrhL
MLTSTSDKDTFNPALSAVRVGLVAYLVASLATGVFFPGAPSLGASSAALTGLFVLTGFLLATRYPATNDDGDWWFIKRRLLAIWPLHAAVMGLALLVAAPLGPHREAALAVELSLIHAWIPIGRIHGGISPLSWILSVHLVFVLFLVLLTPRFERNWPLKLAASVAGAAALVTTAAVMGLPERAPDGVDAVGLAVVHPFARLFEFVAGMATALAWRRRRTRDEQASLLVWTAIEASALLATAGALTALGLSARSLPAALAPSAGLFLAHALLTPIFAGLILILALRRGALTRWAPRRILAALDEIAVPALLVHAVLVPVYVRHRLFIDVTGLQALGAVVALDILIALALTRLIIRPARAMARRDGEVVLRGGSAGSLAFAGLRSPLTIMGLAGFGALVFAVHMVWRPDVLAETTGPAPEITKAGSCVLDGIDVRPGLVMFNGWHANIDEGTTPEPVVFRFITESATYTATAKRLARPDVVRAFKKPSIHNAGIRGLVARESIPLGVMSIQIETGSGRARRVCGTPRKLVSDGRGFRLEP